MRWTLASWVGTALLGVASLSAPALGQANAPEAAPATDPNQKINLTTPPPTPPKARSYRVHEGFYLRAAFGLGTLGSDHDYTGVRGNPNLEGGGSGLAGDLWVGFAPAPGMNLGGGVSLTQAFSVSLEDAGFDAGDRSLMLLIAGPVFDAYPIATKGFHLGAMVGGAGLSLGGVAGGPDWAFGFGGSVWGGYDVWVADEWSVGALLRFQAAAGSASKGGIDVDASALGIGLLLGVVYN